MQLIDKTNVALVLLSCVLAHLLPIELLIISYAFLGPAHYLTEISWLHDRQYFTKQRYDVVLMVLLTIVALTIPASYGVLIIALFCLAISMAFTADWWKRIAYSFVTTTGLLLLSQIIPLSAYFFMLLPTLVHVLLFTAVFVLLGALRSNSVYGYLTFIALIVCSATFFFDGGQLFNTTQYGIDNSVHVAGIYGDFMQMLGIEEGSQFVTNVVSFFGFAYTYHYLNWFSKTKVINWNAISKQRFAVIALLYVASVAIYAYDYALGFKVLLFLSFLHVVLEFPLNGLSFVEVGKLLKSRMAVKLAPSS